MNHIIMFIAGAFGILLYAFRKVAGIRQRNTDASFGQVFGQYWKSDWNTIISSIVAVLVAIFISSEYLNLPKDTDTPIGIFGLLQYKIALFLRTTFVVIGYSANSLVDLLLGTTEAKIQQKAKENGLNNNSGS